MKIRNLPLLFLAALTAGCLSTAPEGLGPAQPAATTVAMDFYNRPLPEIPLPNDVATWPDPSSPTGLRLNVSTIAPTHMEQDLRGHFADLDGWSTYGPITIPLDGLIDLNALLERQALRALLDALALL